MPAFNQAGADGQTASDGVTAEAPLQTGPMTGLKLHSIEIRSDPRLFFELGQPNEIKETFTSSQKQLYDQASQVTPFHVNPQTT
jgi:hypothetical protein